MKIPRQLVIKGAHWNVVLTRTLNVCEGEQILGLCDPSLRTITIDKKQTPKQQWSTFMHEVLHALEFEYQVPISHKIIEKIEGPLGDFVKDNCQFL